MVTENGLTVAVQTDPFAFNVPGLSGIEAESPKVFSSSFSYSQSV